MVKLSSSSSSTASTSSAAAPSRWAKSIDSLRKHRHRMGQEVLQYLGKVDPSCDAYFEKYQLRFYSIISDLKSVLNQMIQFRAHLTSTNSLYSQLGDSIQRMSRNHSNKDAKMFKALDTSQQPLQHGYTAAQLISAAIISIEKKVVQMESHQVLINTRLRKKLDRDGYERKHWTSKRSKSKFLKSQDLLASITHQLYQVFASYEAQRESLISPELDLFRQAIGSPGNLVKPTKEEIQIQTQKIFYEMVGIKATKTIPVTREKSVLQPKLKPPVPQCPRPLSHKAYSRKLKSLRSTRARSNGRSLITNQEESDNDSSNEDFIPPPPPLAEWEATRQPTLNPPVPQESDDDSEDFIPPPPPLEEWEATLEPPMPQESDDDSEDFIPPPPPLAEWEATRQPTLEPPVPQESDDDSEDFIPPPPPLEEWEALHQGRSIP